MAANKYETVVLPKLTLIEAWARNGLTDKQISKNLGIAYSTFCEYKKISELSEALKRSKEIVDTEVENALLKRAVGYTVNLLKQKVTKNGDVLDCYEEIHIPADTTAQIFWLKNRRPDIWRDKQNVEHSGAIKTGSFAIEVAADEQDSN